MLLHDTSRSCDVNAAVPLQIPNKQGELELVTLLQAAERNNSVEIVQLIKEQVSVTVWIPKRRVYAKVLSCNLIKVS